MSADELQEIRALVTALASARVADRADREHMNMRLELLETAGKVTVARFERGEALVALLQHEAQQERKILVAKMDQLLALMQTPVTVGT